MMRITFLLLVLATVVCHPLLAKQPESVMLFSYATAKDKGHSGLHFEWRADGKKCSMIGNEYGFVKSDYGPWGSEKQINQPYLFQDPGGEWHCIWSLNEKVNQFSHVTSGNLVNWGRQAYPFLNQDISFTQPVVHYDKNTRIYAIAFKSGNEYYRINTSNFKTFEPAVSIPASAYNDDRAMINLPSGRQTGNIHKVGWAVIAKLNDAWQQKQFKSIQAKESPANDSIQFAALKPLTASVVLQPENRVPISDLLTGVFFEDINYAADGGLYAELIQNRDFEYQQAEKLYRDSSWNSRHSWSTKGDQVDFTIDSVAPLHPNNPHYAVLDVKQPGCSLINSGYDGIALKKGDTYNLSFFAKNADGKSQKLQVKLVAEDGTIVAQTIIATNSVQWKKYAAILTSSADASKATLELQPLSACRMMFDVVSLFPEKTFKKRVNGLRPDLAETIAAIHPKFIRFPGGCVAHGDGIDNIYRWKNTIGPIETRKPQANLWRYHQTAGLGYFEYFQYCEDIGAQPLPVIAAGVPCQNSGLLTGACGQQNGIPMSGMAAYTQDILDLVEWANGPASSKWGKLRAEAGHPAPFNLKYIGIGNEDLISDVFEERFTMIYKALQQKHPEITVIGTVGPFYEGTDYDQGWALANKLKVPIVDEHYYESPGWFIHNQDFYDRYDRNKSKVYLGEYASRGNTLFNALSEALYLLSVERNGDVVSMASYAPLLAKENHTQWNPNLIYFNNTEVKPTVNYKVQKLFGNYAGNEYIPSTIQLSGDDEAVKKRFGVSVVRSREDSSVIIKFVNLLPVSTSVKLDLANLSVGTKGEKSQLKGLPNDKITTESFTAIAASNIMEEILPPYSFTVLKINNQEKKK
jgi:alpha-L-arabinofuranosidase